MNNDIDLSFVAMPNGDLRGLGYVESVKASVLNLMLLDTFDIPYDNSFTGNGLKQLLFEQPNHVTATAIAKNIEWLIESYEPRVKLESVVVTALTEAYNIDIVYTILKLNTTETVTALKSVSTLNTRS